MFSYFFLVALMIGFSAWWGVDIQDVPTQPVQATIEEEVVNPLPVPDTTGPTGCCDIGAPPPMF